jgi:hypothetical protein
MLPISKTTLEIARSRAGPPSPRTLQLPFSRALAVIWWTASTAAHWQSCGLPPIRLLLRCHSNLPVRPTNRPKSGGQRHDGAEGRVRDTREKLGKVFAHVGTVEKGPLKVGDAVELYVNRARRVAIRANHSATHLLSGLKVAALNKALNL